MRAQFSIIMTVWLISGTASAAERSLNQTTRYQCDDGKKVVVDVTGLDVEIRAADVAEIEITTELKISGVGAEKAERWIASRTPEIVDSEDRLQIVSKPGKSGFLGLGHFTSRSRLQILTPTRAVPDITTTAGSVRVKGDFPLANPLRLRTATGTLEFSGAAHSMDIRSASGDARLEVLRPLERLFARTSSGDITLSGGARDVEVDTATGNIWLANLSGSATVETSTGKVTLRWDRLNAEHEVNVRSASGRVNLTVPESIQPSGSLSTTGGAIRCELPGQTSDLGDSVTLEGSGPRIVAETASGELSLVVGDPWDR